MHITSAANPRYKSLAALSQKKGRKEQGLFLAEGLQALTFALQAGWQPVTLIHTQTESHPLLKPLQQAAAHTLTMPPALLARLTRRDNPQTVLATFPIRTLPLPKTPKSQNPKTSNVILALDRIRDPGNLGTILRTADAAGVANIVLIGDCTDPFAPEVVRATMGSLFHATLHHASEEAFIEWANASSATLIGTHLKGNISFRQLGSLAPSMPAKAAPMPQKTPSGPAATALMPATGPLVVLMGTEQTGLSDTLTKSCTYLTKIPMLGKLESLNLATATALILYELKRNLLS